MLAVWARRHLEAEDAATGDREAWVLRLAASPAIVGLDTDRERREELRARCRQPIPPDLLERALEVAAGAPPLVSSGDGLAVDTAGAPPEVPDAGEMCRQLRDRLGSGRAEP